MIQIASFPNEARLFVDFALSEEGQKIISSFGRAPTRRGVTPTAQGVDKLNFVIDDIGAGEDFKRYNELFRNIFGAPKS